MVLILRKQDFKDYNEIIRFVLTNTPGRLLNSDIVTEWLLDELINTYLVKKNNRVVGISMVNKDGVLLVHNSVLRGVGKFMLNELNNIYSVLLIKPDSETLEYYYRSQGFVDVNHSVVTANNYTRDFLLSMGVVTELTLVDPFKTYVRDERKIPIVEHKLSSIGLFDKDKKGIKL